MPKVLADVAVVINPATVGFRQKADALLRRDLAGFKPKIQLGVDTKDSAKAVADLKGRMEAMRDTLAKMRADVTTKAAEAKIAALQARLSALIRSSTNITMGVDTKKVDAAIAREIAQAKKLRQQLSDQQIDADSARAIAKISALQAESFHLNESLSKLTANVDIRKAEDRIRAIDAELRVLNSDARTIQLKAERGNLQSALAVSEAEILRLRREAADISLGKNVDTAKLLGAESALLGIESVVEKLGSKDSPIANTAMNAFFRSTKSGTTAAAAGWRLLTGHITLFGGVLNTILPKMFTSVAVWHLLADAVIELIAVWVPAAIAVAAFGVAGADAATDIFKRMQAVHTVMTATGQAVPPLTNSFKSLQEAVRPEVYQLFGDALLIMNKRGGAFNQIATGTGHVLDQLAARFVVAVTTGSGVNKFMQHAVDDVQKLGDSFAAFGSIFASVFRAVPGYAEILLTVGNAILHVIAAFANFAEPVIAAGLLLHGFFIYGGLAVTMSLGLVAGIVKLAGAFTKFNEAITLVGYNALKSFALSMVGVIKLAIGWTVAMFSLAASDGVAAASMYALSQAATLLSKVPVIFWVTLVASAIAGLVILLRSSHNATQDFADGLQKTIQAASGAQLLPTLMAAQASNASRLAKAQSELANTTKYLTVQNIRTGQSMTVVSGAWNAAKSAVDILRNSQSQLGDQYRLVAGRVGILAKTYGGNTQALGALNAAGITTQQLLTKGSAAWAVIKVQVAATTAAYQAMGTQAGTLGNDLDVLGRTVTDEYQAISKLNQAWGSFISDVTGTQGAFDTVAQGFKTLSDHSGKLTFSLGKLKVKYADAHAAIDSLTPAGIALNQAFGDQVQNVDKLFASWRTAGIANNLFTEGVKAAIQPMVKYARGSQEATAQLVALAQEAGYQGPISMQALTKWLGNAHGSTQRLKDITNQATTQEALLTGAMQAQGSYIANQLLNDINNAILKYNGVRDAAAAYGRAVAQSGRDSDAAHQARNRLITDLVLSGRAADQSKGQIAAMITKVLGIPPKEAMQIIMTGDGSFRITTGTGQAPGTHTAAGRGSGGLAAGGFIDMGTGPTADDVPIMASKGEYVVQAKAVNKYGKQTMDKINAGAYARGGLIPGYASGGVLLPHVANMIPTGDTSVLTGQYAVGQHETFRQTMLNSFISQMRAELSRQKAAAQAGLSQQVGNVGSGVARWAGLVLQALAMEGLPASYLHYVLYQMQTESGGNPNAINNWDSNAAAGDPSRGLMQTIMSTFLAYHWPGTSFNIYDPLANIAAALNYGAHNGRGFGTGAGQIGSGHGYAAGGLIGGLASGGSVTAWHSKIKAAQAREYQDYMGFRKAELASLKAARPGSYLSGHKSTITGELGTLAKRQSAEEAAYDAVFHKGGTKTVMSHLNSTLRALMTTTRDKGLSYSGPGGHPGWLHEIQHQVTALEKIATGPVPAGAAVPVRGPKLTQAAFMAKLKALQRAEYHDYIGLENAFKTGLRHPAKGSWLYVHRGQIAKDMANLKRLQSGEEAGYDNILHHGTSLANLQKEMGRIRPEISALKAGELSHLPGGHPGWVKGLSGQLANLNKLLSVQPFNAPWVPGHLGPVHTVLPGVEKFDKGGYLRPGLNLAWNGLGRPEPVGDAIGGGKITLEVVSGGGADFDQFMLMMIRRYVRVRGGGNVQTAFGRNG
jgi:hypothetical protein